jgi:MATE family multidrug resistance protein
MFALAFPVVIAELGWMTMGMVDTLMVGRLGPEAIGAVGLGSALFIAIGIFAMGMLLGLDTLVSQSFGAGRLDECRRWLIHGVALSVVLTIPTTLLLFWVSANLDRWGMNPDVLRLMRPYLDAIAWSTLPLLVYFCAPALPPGARCRAADHDHADRREPDEPRGQLAVDLRQPRGSSARRGGIGLGHRSGEDHDGGIALRGDCAPRAASAAGLLDTPLSIEAARLRRLVALGAPAAGQLTLEVGVFAMASALAGRMLPASLAAHQIALNLAGFTYMVPLGVASAGAVRVGQAIGRRDAAGAARAGWTALLFGVVFMSVAAVAFVAIPGRLIGAFTTDARVLEIGVALLAVAAVFQLFDGLQTVGTGVLRGLGETRLPMLWNLAGHWFIGLPIAYLLAFHFGFGVIGLWWGLSSGLIICGVALLIVWWRRIHAVPHLLSTETRRIHA